MKNLLLILLAVFLTNCKSDDNSQIPIQTEIFKIVAQGFFSGDNITTTTTQNNVLTNQNDWNQLVTLLSSEHHDLSTVAVNFSYDNIVFVRDEPRPDGRYAITIDKVLYTSTEIQIYIRKIVNDDGSHMPIQPFCVAKISKTNLPVNFY